MITGAQRHAARTLIDAALSDDVKARIYRAANRPSRAELDANPEFAREWFRTIDLREKQQRANGAAIQLTEEIGRRCGFPACCVSAFLTYDHLGQPKRKLNGTGYIPCLICNEMSESVLIERIRLSRDPALSSFPTANAARMR